MIYIFACVALGFAIFFVNKYFRQKVAIRLLAESLSSRTSILTHSTEFRGVNENWELLLGELNGLISLIPVTLVCALAAVVGPWCARTQPVSVALSTV